MVGNAGTIPPAPGYLEGLRTLTHEHGALLIFDEVMTGFRLSLGGAQGLYGIKPDLTTLGKIVGGGLPCGAFGGRTEIVNFLAPLGPVYQAGTLSGNPLAMAAGIATLKHLIAHKDEVYPKIAATTAAIANGVAAIAEQAGIPLTTNRVGSMFTWFFSPESVTHFTSAQLLQHLHTHAVMMENASSLPGHATLTNERANLRPRAGERKWQGRRRGHFDVGHDALRG